MRFCLDTSILCYPNWSGVQFFAYRILERILADSDHAWTLRLDQPCADPRARTLMELPTVKTQIRNGNLAFHSLLPLDLLAVRAQAYVSFSSRLKTALPCPAAIVLHDIGNLRVPELYGVSDVGPIRRQMKAVLSRLSGLIVVSETVKWEVAETLDFDPDRITVVSNAPAFDPENAFEARRPSGHTRDNPFFLMVNPGRRYKNWEDVFAGFSILAQQTQYNDVMLVLAGDLRDEEQRIDAFVQEHPFLKSRITTLGYVTDGNLRWLYENALALVMPSRYEGFGIPVLESFSYNLPVIVSEIPVLREVAGNAAAYVPLNNPESMNQALQRMCDDAAFRNDLVQAGQLRRVRYSWDNSADQFRNVLATLVG